MYIHVIMKQVYFQDGFFFSRRINTKPLKLCCILISSEIPNSEILILTYILYTCKLYVMATIYACINYKTSSTSLQDCCLIFLHVQSYFPEKINGRSLKFSAVGQGSLIFKQNRNYTISYDRRSFCFVIHL